MKLSILLLFLLMTFSSHGGTGAIPNGNNIKMLKDNIRFKNTNTRIMTNDSDDPSSVAKDAEIGSLYIKSDDGVLYQKQDSGSSTNWLPMLLGPSGSGTDNCLVRWDGTGTPLLQDSLLCVDDVGVVTGATQLNVDNIRIDGNVISSTDVNGTIDLDPNGTGTVRLVDLTSGSIPFIGAGGSVLENNANLSWNDGANQLEITGSALIDNIGIDGNTISSEDINGNIVLTPNGTGEVSISSDLTVTGDFTVNGTTTTINSSTLTVTDQQITVNSGGTQASANANDAGIEVEMSDATNAGLYYDSTFTSLFGVGLFNDFREIVTVDQAQDVTGKTLLEVDNLQLNGNTIASTDTNGNVEIDANGTGITKFWDETEFLGENHFKPDNVTDGYNINGTAASLTFRRHTSGSPTLFMSEAVTNAYAPWRFLASQATKTIPTVQMGASTTGFNYEATGTLGMYMIANSVNVMNVFENGVDIPTVSFSANNISIGTNTISSNDTNGDIILDPNGTGAVNLPDLTVSQPAYINASGDLVSQDLSLTTDVTGTLPEANGGTGVTDMSTILVELAGAQTISGSKTFDDALTMLGITTPSNPSAGDYKLYFKTDGNLYKLNSAGTEVQVDSGASASVYVDANGNAAGSLTGGVNAIDWDTEVADAGGDWDGNTFTAPSDGVYSINGVVRVSSATTFSIRLFVDTGAGYVDTKALQFTNDSKDYMPFAGAIQLSTGDKIKFVPSASITLVDDNDFHVITIWKD